MVMNKYGDYLVRHVIVLGGLYFGGRGLEVLNGKKELLESTVSMQMRLQMFGRVHFAMINCAGTLIVLNSAVSSMSPLL